MSRDAMVDLGVVVEEAGEGVEEEVMGEVEVGMEVDVEGAEGGVGIGIERFRIPEIKRLSKGNKEASGSFGKRKARLSNRKIVFFRSCMVIVDLAASEPLQTARCYTTMVSPPKKDDR
jgi:hypothetical protein